MMYKLIGWALIAFAVFYVLINPDGAAALAAHLFDAARSAARSLSAFLSNL
jgi:hypothetical protein